MKTKQRNGQTIDTKTRIFEAAAELFATYGFERVSIRQICEAVGVQKPTLYYYFKDKETLILEMIRYSESLVKMIRQKFVTPQQNFLDKMRGVLYGRKYFVEHFPHFFRFYAMLHLFSTTDTVKQEMLKLMLPLMEEFKALLREGQQQGYIAPDDDLEMIMETLLGTLNSLSVKQFVFMDDSAFSEENLQRVFEFWQKHLFVKPEQEG